MCFICFEKFNILRVLFCFYVFCYNCIFIYIVSLCELKEVLVGFLCLLCREFVLLLIVIVKLDIWVECLLICEIIDKFVEVKKLILCLLC